MTPMCVVAAALGTEPAEPALRAACAEAQRSGAAVTLLAVGRAGPGHDAELADLAARWAEKYPDVPVTLRVRRSIDPAVTLTAGSRGAALLVLTTTGSPRANAVVFLLRRRAHCPLRLVEDPVSCAAPAPCSAGAPPAPG